MRLERRGWKRVIHPAHSFVHAHGATTSKMPNKDIIRELYISKIYTYGKYHSLLQSLAFRTVVGASLLFKPRKWYLLKVVARGESLSHSMKHRVACLPVNG